MHCDIDQVHSFARWELIYAAMFALYSSLVY